MNSIFFPSLNHSLLFSFGFAVSEEPYTLTQVSDLRENFQSQNPESHEKCEFKLSASACPLQCLTSASQVFSKTYSVMASIL